MSTYKRKATEAELGHSSSDDDESEDEIDIPEDDDDSHMDRALTAGAMNGVV